MFESAENALPYITVGLLALALALLFFSLRLFRRSRADDTYWRRRREASQRGLRLFMVSFILLIASGASCLFTLLFTMIEDDDDSAGAPTATLIAQESTAEQTPTPTGVPSTNTATVTLPPDASVTIAPQATATPTLTGTPTQPATTTNTPVIVVVTATPQFTPTPTPYPTFTPPALPSAESDAEATLTAPEDNAEIIITALDDRISDTLEPVNPRVSFAAGTTRIYVFVEFSDMDKGVPWSRELYHDGELIDSARYQWGQDRDGETYFFFGSDSGFEPGTYEIRLMVGDDPEPINTETFTIRPASS